MVCGKPEEKSGTFTDYIIHDKKNNTSSVTLDKNAGSLAKLEYEVIASIEDESCLSLVRIHLLTGRHHQIRVQFASRGLPLYADSKYGNGTGKGSNVALCAYRLEINGKVYEVKPQGEIFKKF